MKPYYPLIVLVVASTDHLIYKELKRVWSAYMHLNSNVKCFFLHSRSHTYKSLENPDEDLYFPDTIETPAKFIDKTVLGCEYICKNYEFDYMIRTNLSTLWLWDRVLERIKTFPKTEGFIGRSPALRHPDYHSVAGHALFMSKDLACAFGNSKEYIDTIKDDQAEDRTISRWCNEYMKVTPIVYRHRSIRENRCRAIEGETEYNFDNIEKHIEYAETFPVDHYRVKSNIVGRETVDIPIFKHLIKHYYGIEL